jgi:hypothetical protein
VQTQWGTHTLTQATRLLLHAALANPLNQRFTLVCGSTLPVRPALFTYTQLMGESRSRFGIQQGWFTFYNPNWVGSTLSPCNILPPALTRSCHELLIVLQVSLSMLHHASCHRIRLGRSAYHSSVQCIMVV